MTVCDSVDKVTNLRCVQAEGHPGLCACPTGKGDEMRFWGTITIPGEILDAWVAEAEEAKRG